MGLALGAIAKLYSLEDHPSRILFVNVNRRLAVLSRLVKIEPAATARAAPRGQRWLADARGPRLLNGQWLGVSMRGLPRPKRAPALWWPASARVGQYSNGRASHGPHRRSPVWPGWTHPRTGHL